MELCSDLQKSSRKTIPDNHRTLFTPGGDNSKSNTTCTIANCVHISDRYVPPRAVLALPEMLKFRHDNIFPRRSLPSRIRFGPIEGIRQSISKMKLKELIQKSLELKKPLFLLKADDDFVIHLDNTDRDKTNWLTLLSLGDQNTANVWLYEEANELYAITTKSIPSREPLKLGYSSEYVLVHGFLPQSPCLDIHEVLSSPPTEWWCYECQRAMLSEALLKHHKDTEHKVDKANSRQQYKCQRCKRKFSRLFTLKRHMMMHCSKSNEKTTARPKPPANPPANVEPEMNTNPLLEESRVPSEDVLHNFTSSLDFNNLFDTYRVSSLDLSGGSKSSLDINEPENQLCKNNNVLVDLPDPFTRISSEVRDYSSNGTSDKIEGSRSDLNEILPACSTDIKTNSDKKQEQVRDVPVDIFSCECGHIFSNKEKLIRHVMDPTNCKKTVETSDIMYKCEDCQLIFKRRGMFVNHLWRVHKNNTTSIPLERRVRYYPCGICTKIYCTAAKRDRHVNKHHPGTRGGGARAVESGRRACAAAACAACPRQYASRAKLLQHVRAAHPAHHAHLAHNPTLVPFLKTDETADPKI